MRQIPAKILESIKENKTHESAIEEDQEEFRPPASIHSKTGRRSLPFEVDCMKTLTSGVSLDTFLLEDSVTMEEKLPVNFNNDQQENKFITKLPAKYTKPFNASQQEPKPSIQSKLMGEIMEKVQIVPSKEEKEMYIVSRNRDALERQMKTNFYSIY